MGNQEDTETALRELEEVNSLQKLWKQLRQYREKELQLKKWDIICNYSIAIFVGVLFAGLTYGSGATSSDLATQYREVASFLIQYIVFILGIILIGVTLLPSISRDSFLRVIAEERHSQTGFLWVQYIYLNFVNAFAFFLNFGCVVGGMYLAGIQGGPASTILSAVTSEGLHEPVRRIVVCFAIGTASGWSVLSLHKMKAFIFNLYRVIMFIHQWVLLEDFSTEQRREKLKAVQEREEEGSGST